MKPLEKAPWFLSLVHPRSRSVRDAPARWSESPKEQKQDVVRGAFDSVSMDPAPGYGILALGDGENLIRSGPHITFIYSGAQLPPLRK